MAKTAKAHAASNIVARECPESISLGLPFFELYYFELPHSFSY